MRICNLMHMFSKIVYCKEHTDLREKKSLNMYLCLHGRCSRFHAQSAFFYPFLRKFFESKRDKWSRGSLHSLCIKCRSLQKVVRFLWIKKQERIIDFKANVSQEIFLILCPPFENSTTRIAIVIRQLSDSQQAVIKQLSSIVQPMGLKASSVLFFEKSTNLGNVVYPLQCEQKEVDLCKEYASCFMLLRLLHTLSAEM